MQFFCIPSLYYSFLFLRGETGNFCEYEPNYDYHLGVRRVECSPGYRGSSRSNENAITMIHFMLNDLRRPTGKGIGARLEFSRLPLHFDSLVELAHPLNTPNTPLNP